MQTGALRGGRLGVVQPDGRRSAARAAADAVGGDAGSAQGKQGVGAGLGNDAGGANGQCVVGIFERAVETDAGSRGIERIVAGRGRVPNERFRLRAAAGRTGMPAGTGRCSTSYLGPRAVCRLPHAPCLKLN